MAPATTRLIVWPHSLLDITILQSIREFYWSNQKHRFHLTLIRTFSPYFYPTTCIIQFCKLSLSRCCILLQCHLLRVREGRMRASEGQWGDLSRGGCQVQDWEMWWLSHVSSPLSPLLHVIMPGVRAAAGDSLHEHPSHSFKLHETLRQN